MTDFEAPFALSPRPVFPGLTTTLGEQNGTTLGSGNSLVAFGVEAGWTRLPRVGTLCRVLQLRDGEVLVEGEARVALLDTVGPGTVRVRALNERSFAADADFSRLRNGAEMLALSQQTLPLEAAYLLSKARSLGALCDLISANLDRPLAWKQQVLETVELERRLALVDEEVRKALEEGAGSPLRRRLAYAMYKRVRSLGLIRQ